MANKPARSRLAVLMFFYFLAVTFSVYVIKPAKESLFLNFLGRERLPYAFLMSDTVVSGGDGPFVFHDGDP